MARFTDRLGREWQMEIRVADIKAVRTALNINLFDAFAGDYSVYSSIISDVEKLVAVAFILCREQVQERQLTEEQFGRGVAGDSLRALGDAFTEGLVDFFPNARAREAVRATLNKAKELIELQTKLLAEAVQALDPGLMLGSPSATSSAGFTSAPASPASIPDPSASANSSG